MAGGWQRASRHQHQHQHQRQQGEGQTVAVVAVGLALAFAAWRILTSSVPWAGGGVRRDGNHGRRHDSEWVPGSVHEDEDEYGEGLEEEKEGKDEKDEKNGKDGKDGKDKDDGER